MSEEFGNSVQDAGELEGEGETRANEENDELESMDDQELETEEEEDL